MCVVIMASATDMEYEVLAGCGAGGKKNQCRIIHSLYNNRNSDMEVSFQTILSLSDHCPTSFLWALGH